MGTIKAYYRLTKPGIMYGNSLTVAAGFLFASGRQADWTLFVATLAGVACVIAASCVFNNYLDREIDSKMARTKDRALVSGEISPRSAIIFADVLALLGFTILGTYVNTLTLMLGVLAMFFYVVVYGYAKRKSWHGTLVGTVPGALPLVASYTAVTNDLNEVALVLFLIMAIWQMPHFYAIAIYRKQEYASAGIPVISIVKGVAYTKKAIVAYIALLISFLGVLLGYTIFSAPVLDTWLLAASVAFLAVNIRWLTIALQGFQAKDDAQWARGVFGFSLTVLLVFCVLLITTGFLEPGSSIY
jgi:protoheme IX farnesyltransferase